MSTHHHLGELYRHAHAAAVAEHAERRRLVLAHPDLAARLTQPPIGYREPAQWSGYIPPYMIEGPCHAGRNTWTRNLSPVRVHLVAITHEAMARTYGEEIGQAWLEETNTNAWADDWSPSDALRRAAGTLERSSR